MTAAGSSRILRRGFPAVNGRTFLSLGEAELRRGIPEAVILTTSRVEAELRRDITELQAVEARREGEGR